jgi:hypothetical protein
MSEQIENLFENFTAKGPALLTDISIRIAQNYIKTYNNNNNRETSFKHIKQAL